MLMAISRGDLPPLSWPTGQRTLANSTRRIRSSGDQFWYFFNKALASFRSALPLPPLAPTSLIHSSSTDSVAFAQRLYSASLNILMVLWRSTATLRDCALKPSHDLPTHREVSRPLLLSMTFFNSGDKLLYLAWFMANTMMVFDMPACVGPGSVWVLQISCSLNAVVTSHGNVAPSTTFLPIASGTAGAGCPSLAA